MTGKEELQAIQEQYKPFAKDSVEAEVICKLADEIERLQPYEAELGNKIHRVVFWQETNKQSRAQANGYYADLLEARKEIERLCNGLNEIKCWPVQGRSDEYIPDDKELAYSEGYENALTDISEIFNRTLEGDSK